jgi:hypothetical protein
MGTNHNYGKIFGTKMHATYCIGKALISILANVNRAQNNGWSPVNVHPIKASDRQNFCHVFLKIYNQFTWLVIMSGH